MGNPNDQFPNEVKSDRQVVSPTSIPAAEYRFHSSFSGVPEGRVFSAFFAFLSSFVRKRRSKLVPSGRR
jgi:hypothetical protein